MDKRKINTFKEVKIKRDQITISDTYQLSLGRLVDNLIVDETGDIEEIGTKNLGEIFERNGYTYFLINGQSFDETKHTKLFEILGTNIIPNGVGRYLKATNNNSLEFKNQRFPKHKHLANHQHIVNPHSHKCSGGRMSGLTLDRNDKTEYLMFGTLPTDLTHNLEIKYNGITGESESSLDNVRFDEKIKLRGSKALYYVKSKGA